MDSTPKYMNDLIIGMAEWDILILENVDLKKCIYLFDNLHPS